MSAVGEVFANRYEVLALLGEGGMGSVYRVHDGELGEEVALKVLRVELASDATAIDRFRREVKLARRVTHPNVARTYDVGRHEQIRFLTMELVVGDSLSSLLDGGTRPPFAETLRIAEHIARGLSAAHAAGVVHRDLKPDNVMRCPGANSRIVITDFGIARLAQGMQPPEDLQLTVNQVVGTPAYMAPEQLTAQPIDGRTDVYAFGTLLFELLTGALPFQRATLLATVAARLTEEPPDPRGLDASIPEPVAILTMKAMARRREDRPDAEMMLQMIERLRGGGDRYDRAPSLSRTTATRTELPGVTTRARSVAVAPVDVTAGAAWSAADLGAAIADGLTAVRGARVLPPDVLGRGRESARELGATWMVETSVRAESGRGRARVRLLDLEASTQLWAAAPIDVAEGESFTLEDRLVSAVTAAVRERLGDAAVRPIEPAVRAICDLARDAAHTRTVPGLREAVVILEEGLADHPGDSALLCLLGANLVRLYGMTGATDPQLAASAEEMALRALALDPTLAEAYLAIGLLRLEQGETRAAVRALQETLARAPLLADAHIGLGIVLAEAGNVDEALRRFDMALRLDPPSLGARLERARVKALLGDRLAAEADLRGLDERATYPLVVRAVVWWGDPARAAELAEAFERAATGAPWEAAAPILRAFARGEIFAEAEQVFQRLLSGSQVGSRNRCRAVEVATEYFAAIGDTELALSWLEQAEQLPFVNVLWMDRCVCLDGIRNHPRFVRVRGLVAARGADLWR